MNEITKELLEQLKWLVDHASQHGIMPASLSKSRKAIAKAEAALAKPQADEDGWIPWDGGKCPVSPAMLVEIKLRSGQSWLNKDAEKGSFWGWYHGPKKTPDDIIAYRPLNI